MKVHRRLAPIFALISVCFCGLTAVADVLTISEEEQRLLGIEVQAVAAAASTRTGELTLQVGFSTDGEWVIKSPYPGILYRTHVQAGDRVSAGDPLLTVRSGDIVTVQRDFLKAEADWKLQQAAWQRDRKLRDSGSVSSRRWQETQFAYDMAKAEYAGLRAQLQFAGYDEKDIDRLSRDMNVTPDIVLRAPADALVLERPAMLGDHLEGTELLARLGDPARLLLTGRISRSVAEHLAEGDVIAQQGGTARAIVVLVAQVIDPATQTVHVRAEPTDSTGLAPGQLTRWYVQSGSPVLTVPSSAIVKLEGRDVVYVQTAGGFEEREIDVRNTGGGAWVVLDGLSDGERVAVSGTAALKGMSVGMGGGD